MYKIGEALELIRTPKEGWVREDVDRVDATVVEWAGKLGVDHIDVVLDEDAPGKIGRYMKAHKTLNATISMTTREVLNPPGILIRYRE